MGTEESRYDTAVHFEAALAEWTAQVMQAHLSLAEQISLVREQLMSEFQQDAAMAVSDDVMVEVRGSVDALSKMMADPFRQPTRLPACFNRVKQAVSNLYAELRTLRSQATALALAERNEAGRAADMVRAEKERDAARAELAALRGEMASLRRANEELARTTQQVEQDAKETLSAKAFDARGQKRRMGDILVDAGVITADQLQKALRVQEDTQVRPLGIVLIEAGYTTESVIAQALASQLRLDSVRLAREPIDANATRLINRQMALHHTLIPIRATAAQVTVAMTNPLDLVAIDDVEHATGRRVEPVVATLSDVSEAIVRYYGAS